MGLKSNFLWGGATAANQYEGGYQANGRGLTTLDIKLAGNRNTKRLMTFKQTDGTKRKLDAEEGISEEMAVEIRARDIAKNRSLGIRK